MTGPRGASRREVITMAWDFAATWTAHPQQPPGDREGAPDRPGNRHLRLCPRCGGVGTHHLTCPRLRLPADRHRREDSVPEHRGSLAPDRAAG
jgi:hypothetical protein